MTLRQLDELALNPYSLAIDILKYNKVMLAKQNEEIVKTNPTYRPIDFRDVLRKAFDRMVLWDVTKTTTVGQLNTYGIFYKDWFETTLKKSEATHQAGIVFTE